VTDAAGPPPGEILRVDDLRVTFPGPGGRPLPVVDGISFSLARGEALGLVGESGSGKTMTALSLLGLVPPPGRVSGSIRLAGRQLAGLDEVSWCQVRGSQVGMVFQDALSGLNPVRSIGSVLMETVLRHRRIGRAEARLLALETLSAVGIPRPEERLGAYPHQLSGGQRQRVMIALAIVNQPSLIVADEPTTALDNTIQAQILEVMGKLLEHSALILITHDLGVAASLCDRVAVMYAGRICEEGPIQAALIRPRHPYTRGLLDSVPRFDPARPPLTPIPGAPPAPSEVLPGCAFAPRCPRALERCASDRPELAADGGELLFACHNPYAGDGD
jgi:oligopeptide/dipeptide ABC transporter ATP-binding protein